MMCRLLITAQNAAVRLGACRKGASAVEFAFVCPLLILLYLGAVEVTLALNFNQKLKSATSAINDFVGQSSELSRADVKEIFMVAEPILGISTSARLQLQTKTVEIDTHGSPQVVWAVGGTGDAAPQELLPDDIVTAPGDQFVVTSATYQYEPLLAFIIAETITLTSTIHARPRGRKGVSCSDCEDPGET